MLFLSGDKSSLLTTNNYLKIIMLTNGDFRCHGNILILGHVLHVLIYRTLRIFLLALNNISKKNIQLFWNIFKIPRLSHYQILFQDLCRIKPSKHMSVGLGIKSLTGSRKVIDILNHFGHSISYHTIEAIETDLATNIIARNCATPEGIDQSPGLSTGVAWDNYDENTETLSGGNTLHDTVGICYQNIISSSEADVDPNVIVQGADTSNASQSTSQKISKRSLVLKEGTLQPYHKKPKIKVFQYVVKEIPRPPNHSLIVNRDILWMMCLSFTETQMWAGWNSLITEDQLPPQKIAYMYNLNLPPTRLDVIAETLRISQRVAQECDEQYAVVHYDLAVAKPAMQIQQQQDPQYSNVFICFGPFHIEMAYFGVLGYFLDGSGGPEILTETEVLMPGSMNGFLKGKHYNR